MEQFYTQPIDTTKNRAHWQMLQRHALEDFAEMDFDPLQPFDANVIREKLGYFAYASRQLVSFGLTFLANEEYRVAESLFRLGVRAAEEALQREDYGSTWFPEFFRPCGPLEKLFFAKWILEGHFDPKVGKRFIEYCEDILQRISRQDDKRGVGAWIMWVEILLENFEAAKEAYQQTEPRPISIPPVGGGYVSNETAVLYLVAEHASGNEAASGPAERALKKWHHRCHVWYDNPTGTELGQDAMLKCYLYGRHFGGPTTPKEIMLDMRGF